VTEYPGTVVGNGPAVDHDHAHQNLATTRFAIPTVSMQSKSLIIRANDTPLTAPLKTVGDLSSGPRRRVAPRSETASPLYCCMSLVFPYLQITSAEPALSQRS
jgi:hypothetical protein